VDRILGVGGYSIAGLAIAAGLVAQWTGVEWLGWTAFGLAVMSACGVIVLTVRHLIAHRARPGFVWIGAAWVVVVVGWFVIWLIPGDSAGLNRETLESLATSEVAAPSVVFGLALGLASVGILRGVVRPKSRTTQTSRFLILALGLLTLAWGVIAWTAPQDIGDLEGQPGYEIEMADGSYVVRDRAELETRGWDGDTEPPADAEVWVVVAGPPGSGGEVLYGPAIESEAADYLFGPELLVFEGSEAELEAWLGDGGTAYKDYWTPSLIVILGATITVAALALAPKLRIEGSPT
jgi:hypothetical protein